MELNIITAQEGMWLTQSSLKDETLRVFSKKVYNPTSEWEEVTDEYKIQWEAEHANPEIPEIYGGASE